MLKAITRKTRAVDEKVQDISKAQGVEISTGYFFDHLATDDDVQVVVSEQDFTAAQDELVGSVSKKELEHFERIRGLFEEQDITLGSKDSSSNDVVSGATKRDEANLPLRPAPPVSAPVRLSENQGPKTATSPPYLPSSQPLHLAQTKGKGKQKASAGSDTNANAAHKQTPKIGNPDSGASSDADDDYGVSMSHSNGAAINGMHPDKGKGKGKGRERERERERERSPPVDGFVDDVEGDDEGLYDD